MVDINDRTSQTANIMAVRADMKEYEETVKYEDDDEDEDGDSDGSGEGDGDQAGVAGAGVAGAGTGAGAGAGSSGECADQVRAGPAADSIEKYYQERLGKKDREKKPGQPSGPGGGDATDAMAKAIESALVLHMMYHN